ncbi:flagellar basal body-associated FliL family protein [Actibacterium sp. XHP0104]|uniref:flagellar basal body-associated FliL family protein n=1 Tax=Actibacterium sp. XHP0104 TaxID=2984335 RepID=UPI0021E74294|nr:flagellar basal body-associated FliL family protein [Actibacterium sp. XHP0104]MCV2881807.1 flagellar basal body-associated protein FliL [Actibacterium sp. XHP0104]
MRLLLPLVIALVGLGAGTGAGFFLRPPPAPIEAEAETPPPDDPAEDTVEFVKMNNQFVVPVVENERVTALVVMSLSLEVELGERARVYQMEPKLRDAFLGVMFDHANTGGFAGVFTSSTNMTALRIALIEVARKTLGPSVHDVLIIDLVRQDS